MKCLLLCILSLWVCLPAGAQDEALKPTVKIENIVKPGSKLIYEVEEHGQVYNFIVTVKDLKGTSFDWEMTAPVNKKGRIDHTTKALKSGNVLFNYFTSGPKNLDDKTTSVWLSTASYNAFTNTAGKPIKMYLHGPNADPQMVGTYTGAIPLDILVDGKKEIVEVELVRELKLMGSDGYMPSSSDDFLHISSSPKVPIIIGMRLDFNIHLKEIKTH
jgi:hypothetical protein